MESHIHVCIHLFCGFFCVKISSIFRMQHVLSRYYENHLDPSPLMYFRNKFHTKSLILSISFNGTLDVEKVINFLVLLMKLNMTLDGIHHMMGVAVVVGYTTTYAIIAVSFNSACGKLSSIQHYVIKFVIELQWFSLGTLVSSNNKTDHHDTWWMNWPMMYENWKFELITKKHSIVAAGADEKVTYKERFPSQHLLSLRRKLPI